MNLDEELKRIKGEENKEVALLVLEDGGLRKICAAWGAVSIKPHPNPPLEGEGATAWEELWAAVCFDALEVAELSGISPGECKIVLKRAIGLRLIYPDGTLHSLAKMALQKRIKDALQG